MPRPTSLASSPGAAAQYLRMSTEHQRYSIDNQAAAIADFAALHGFKIVSTYVDRGRSGLSIRRREGLKRLLADAMTGSARFKTILVYDVSRWGRFQDIDQAAHYEFLCRDAGIAVEYCAEPFSNDGSLVADLIKTLKRAGAAQYSRDLSLRVTAAQRRGAADQYWMGGETRYGFRRLMVDDKDRPIALLAPGERKALQHHRVRLVLGPPEELAIVREIFRRYAAGETPKSIAADLRARQVPGWCGMDWTDSQVRRMIPDERYAGVWTHGKSRTELGRGARLVPRRDWLRRPGALPRIVDPRSWDAARAVWLWRRGEPTEKFMLQGLRRVLAKHGRLSRDLVAREPGIPTPKMYRKVFGDLPTAFRKVGFEFKPRRRLVGPFLPRIEAMVRDGADRPPGERASPNLVFQRLKTEGYKGAMVTVQRELRRIRQDMEIGHLPRLAWRDDAEILAEIRAVYEAHGYLTMGLLAEHPDLPSLSALTNHFGSFGQLYALVGCRPGRTKWRIGPFMDRLEALAAAESAATPGVRLPYMKLFQQLVAEGFTGSYTSVRKHLVGVQRAK